MWFQKGFSSAYVRALHLHMINSGSSVRTDVRWFKVHHAHVY